MHWTKLLLALGVGAVAGCTPTGDPLTIDRFLALTSGQGCVADPASKLDIGEGRLDVGIATEAGTQGYWAIPIVTNNVVNYSQSTGVSNGTIELTGFDVQLLGPAAQGLSTAESTFTVPAAGVLLRPGANGTGHEPTPGESAASLVQVVPRAILSKLASALPMGSDSTIIAHVRARGTDVNGTVITSPYVDLPIIVCSFCLTPPPQPCPAGGFPTGTVNTSCFPQQDEPVTCCTEGQTLLCGSSVPVSSGTTSADGFATADMSVTD